MRAQAAAAAWLAGLGGVAIEGGDFGLDVATMVLPLMLWAWAVTMRDREAVRRQRWGRSR